MVARPGDVFVVLLVIICCRWCHFSFSICRSCYRGHAYCCDRCRIAGKQKSHCKAQRRYRKTDKGRKSHRLAENRRRIRQKSKKRSTDAKKLDDASSTPLSKRRIVVSSLIYFIKTRCKIGLSYMGQCHFCGAFGKIVDKYPRRDYGA